MTAIASVTLDVPEAAAAERLYADAFGGLGDRLRFREAQDPSTGFRGFTLSLLVSQPGDVDALTASALDAGATELKPAKRSLWGYGSSVRAPDGAIWTVASSSKKDKGPATRGIDDVVLLLGVADVKAGKRFYEERGFPVKRSFGGRYAEFDAPDGRIKLALNPRDALAKNAGVPPDGTGSHRLVVHGEAGPLTDPDGFAWEAAGS